LTRSKQKGGVASAGAENKATRVPLDQLLEFRITQFRNQGNQQKILGTSADLQPTSLA
jgi:hypothetical protein